MAYDGSWYVYSRCRQTIPTQERLAGMSEAELAAAYRDGDVCAGHRLVELHLPLVATIAREYRRWGIHPDDLIQEGSLGLLKAAERFNPERENGLRAYAAYWIRAEIRDYVVRSYRIVRLGTTRTERRAMRAFRSQQIDSVEDLIRVSGMPEARCRLLWPLLAGGDRSLDVPGGPEETDNGTQNPETLTIDREQRKRMMVEVQSALSGLSERERDIITARILSDEPTTLEALGKQMGVSRERVRQLEQRARTKLAASLAPLVA